MLLLHLASTPGDQYEVKSQLVVTDGFQPTDSVYPYFSVTKFWRKALKTELQRLNNHSEDLKEHAWALESIHSITQGKPADVVGVIMVLRWMSTEPVDAPMGHYSPMVHSSRPSPSQYALYQLPRLRLLTHCIESRNVIRKSLIDLVFLVDTDMLIISHSNLLTLPPYSL